MSNWLVDKIIPSISSLRTFREKSSSIPDGMWVKCPKCEIVLYKDKLRENLEVCSNCDHHMKISARERLNAFLDADTMNELCSEIKPLDRLKFKDLKSYQDRLKSAQKSTNENDALITMKGKLKEQEVVVAAFEFNFMGGSMGSLVGDKFVNAALIALENKSPFICFAASGGARMQEGLISLMQMAKTAAVLAKLKENGIPFISVLTNPVYGGVSASFATLGDIIIAEPQAKVGFAGARVIEQTIRETLPDDFQTAEFLMEHGAIDLIVHRKQMRDKIAKLLTSLNAHNQA